MQSLTIYANTPDGLQLAGPEQGPEGARLARLKANYEMEQKSILFSMRDNAVRHKEQGNMAMEKGQYRHAVKEYNHALQHAHAMMEHLQVEKPPPLNGYQLRALAQGQPLPRRGPEQLNPFRALVHANRAMAFLRLDAYDRAIEDSAIATRLEPKYLKGWVRRAAALVASNQKEEALLVLDEALEVGCHDEGSKKQVCDLIVNIRSLGNVTVKPPEEDLPVVYKDSGKVKKPKPQRMKVKVPLMSNSHELAKSRQASGSLSEARETSEEQENIHPDVYAEVDARDLDVFLKEDWHATHLGGRWRQTREEILIVVNLPRRPKTSDLLIQIRPKHLWILIRKPAHEMTGGQDDYDVVVDHDLARTVKPSESCWMIEAEGANTVHLTLQKQKLEMNGDTDITQHLWDRAFFDDVPIDVNDGVASKAQRANVAREKILATICSMQEYAKEQRSAGYEDQAIEVEHMIRHMQQKLGM